MEFGAQLALSAKSSLNADVNDPTLSATEKALVLAQPEYIKAKKEAEDAGKKVGEVTLPYWNILKIGWLL
jgi:hypothetical protein